MTRMEPQVDWNALEAKVSAELGAGGALASLPPFRRVWFESLLRQGRAAGEAGRTALAAHCHARVAAELESLLAQAGTSVAESVPAPAPRRSSPLADLASRHDDASRRRLLAMLDRHGANLPAGEAEVFRAALEGTPPAELRRRLVDRLLRASRYRRRAAALRAWNPVPPAAVPAGPYNDRIAVEQLLHRLAQRHPEWTAEFLDVYDGMRDVVRAFRETLPGKSAR